MFDKDDVLKLAFAVKNQHVVREYAGSSRSDFDGYECRFCCAKKEEMPKNITHDLDCPVLIAKDVMTLNSN